MLPSLHTRASKNYIACGENNFPATIRKGNAWLDNFITRFIMLCLLNVMLPFLIFCRSWGLKK